MEAYKIMGAGPAGLAAAITLARVGLAVTVYERAACVGSHRDGDLEALENFMFQEDVLHEFNSWGIATDFEFTPIYGLTVFGPGFSRMGQVQDEIPLMYFTTRGPAEGTLDRALLSQACAAGAKVIFNRAVRPEEVDIVASGLQRPRAFAVGYNFKTRARDGAFVLVDAKLSPQAYSYIVMCNHHGTVAACATVPQPNMRRHLELVIQGFRSRVDFDMQDPRYFSASVTYTLPRTAKRNGKLYVGEAAGLQDVWTGFGMRIGIASGYLAAQSLIKGSDYDALWRARLDGVLQATAANRALQQTLGNRACRILEWMIKRHPHDVRATLHRYYNRSWYSILLWPWARQLGRS